ncbi:hypothetical protein [Endozoicomonas sp. ALB115]|uniref:hypothetical protein n=1 Tax=Endozoicomonas sp. ALB115 TaxID=3403074 RepID=UPI003BB60C72
MKKLIAIAIATVSMNVMAMPTKYQEVCDQFDFSEYSERISEKVESEKKSTLAGYDYLRPNRYEVDEDGNFFKNRNGDIRTYKDSSRKSYCKKWIKYDLAKYTHANYEEIQNLRKLPKEQRLKIEREKYQSELDSLQITLSEKTEEFSSLNKEHEILVADMESKFIPKPEAKKYKFRVDKIYGDTTFGVYIGEEYAIIETFGLWDTIKGYGKYEGWLVKVKDEVVQLKYGIPVHDVNVYSFKKNPMPKYNESLRKNGYRDAESKVIKSSTKIKKMDQEITKINTRIDWLERKL